MPNRPEIAELARQGPMTFFGAGDAVLEEKNGVNTRVIPCLIMVSPIPGERDQGQQ